MIGTVACECFALQLLLSSGSARPRGSHVTVLCPSSVSTFKNTPRELCIPMHIRAAEHCKNSTDAEHQYWYAYLQGRKVLGRLCAT